MSEIEANDVIARLVDADPNLSQFLEPNFQCEEYAMKIVKTEVVADVLKQLNNSIELLNTELHQQISSRHEDLLAQTTGIESLESVLDVMTSRISSLKELINKISIKITEPFNKIQSKTLQLSRLQDATDFLRRLIRLFYLTKRLRQQMSNGNKEITKAAQTLNELHFLETDGDSLDGINIIEEDRIYIQKTRKELDKEAHRILESGMRSENPSSIATALQVFYNLDRLGTSVNNVFNDICVNAEKSIQEAVDVRLLADNASSKTPGPGKATLNINQANLKNNLWNSLDDMVEQIYLSIVNIQQLQRVLVKKRDPITHVLFCDKLRKEGVEANIGLRFWKMLLVKIEKHLKRSAQYNQVIKSAFELEYPRLLRVILSFWQKVSQNNEGYQLMFYGKLKNQSIIETFDMDLNTDQAGYDYDPEEDLRHSISSFKLAYISSNLNNLSNPVHSAFLSVAGNKSVCPDDNDIESIYKIINSELVNVLFDSKLQYTVSKNIEKVISLFAAKLEGNIHRSNNACQIISAPNEFQLQNINLVNSLSYLHKLIDSIVSENRDHLTHDSKMVLLSAKDQLDELLETTLAPLFASVSDSIEAIILTMHQEDFSISEYKGKKPSAYVREMDAFIKRVTRDHFSFIRAKAIVSNNIDPIAARALSLFVRHSTLIRPLSESGKLKLAQDYVYIEESLSPLCSRLVDLGESYRLLRAFKPLFHASLEELCKNPSLGESVPISMVIQLIISRSPRELRSPFQVADWTQSQYSQWLDEHKSEKERLALLKGTIENYTKSVQKSNKSEFVEELPTILELLKRGLS